MAKTTKETKGKSEKIHKENKNLVQTVKNKYSARGRNFSGTVIKKFPKRIVVEFDRTVFVKKYERFYKKKTRLHARLPDSADVNVGDYVKVMQCRPLSKIIHFIFIEKIHNAGETKE